MHIDGIKWRLQVSIQEKFQLALCLWFVCTCLRGSTSRVLTFLMYCLILVVQFSSILSFVSVSLQRYGLQHARLPYPSPTPGDYSSSCPSIWWCQPTISSCLPLPLLPSGFPNIRVFSNESVLPIRWEKYLSFSISPSNEYSGLISSRIGWFDLPTVQGTLKSLLQHHNLKASILWCSAFFMVQLSHPYMILEKP